MLKLLATTLLLTSGVFAQSTSSKIESYLTGEYEDNPKLKTIIVKVEEIKPLEDLDGWDAYIVALEATLKSKPKEIIKQKAIWFSNGVVITKELTNLSNGSQYTDEIKPDIKPSEYSRENLIYGNENAKHKVAIFSDPLCPFCKDFAPEALKYMKKSIQKSLLFIIITFHFYVFILHQLLSLELQL
ncbi:MAG: thioredoxin domain-containing protein [Sulfurimonas sp.]|nr:thioredoxin domain-containing protein [Sulfurimonas sp.]